MTETLKEPTLEKDENVNMRTYHTGSNVTAGATLATITMLKSGRIKSIRWKGQILNEVDFTADVVLLRNTASAADLLSTKVDPPILDYFPIGQKLTTSGLAASDRRQQTACDIQVSLGENLVVLVLNATGTLDFNVTCDIDVQD